MTQRLAASLLAITTMLAIAAPAAGQSSSPGGFRLPPNPTPTSTPDLQGPVDPDAPIVTRPRAPAPTPTPTPAPRTTPAPAPTATPTTASPAAREIIPRPTPTAATRPLAQPTAAPVEPVEAPREETAPAEASAAPPPQPSFVPPAVSAEPVEVEEEGSSWPWVLLGLLALAAAAAAFVFLRQRREESAEAPTIEPPLARRTTVPPAPEGGEAPPPGSAPAPLVPLMVEAQALKLSRSMMFATLSYELRLVNRGPAELKAIRLGGDLVTAHGRVPVDQQLADPAQPLEVIQQVASLAPGENIVLKGELRLPVQQIRAIPQGKAILYVPLLRLRIEAEGLAAFARTFVVGKRPASPGGKLQPFRLDETPQTYSSIAQRALD